MAADWHFRLMGTAFGPVTGAELVQQVVDGRVRPETEVRKGDGPWIPASKVAGLLDRAALLKAGSPNSGPAPPDAAVILEPPSSPLVADDPDPVVFVSTSNGSPPLPEPSVFVPASKPLLGPDPGAGKYEILDSAEADGFKVEVLAYPKLGGAKDHQTAATVYFANRAGIRLKQVRITLRGGEAIAEAGALHFMLGRIELLSKIGGVAGIGKAMMNKFVTKEAAIMPRYRGTGQIYLEPSFSHFLIYRLCQEELIADKGMFYCGQGGLDVGASLQRNVSSALFGGEGFFQTRIKGTGICVLESPVPADEVLRVDLKDETLQVDGNFALMRTGRIDFSVEKSTRSLLGTWTSGEGLLQTFRGTGSVWLAPTQEIYQLLQSGGLAALGAAPKSSHTAT